jgi:ribonucleoside-triphosphate reductase
VTHNCRLRLDNRELRKRGGGLFASNPMTGSIGVVTINLPKHAYESKEKSVFFESVYNSLLVARKSLSIKRKVLEKYTENGLYPYARFYLSKIKNSKRNQYWSNHFNTIGVIGMNEACLNLINQTIATPEGTQLAIETLEFIREKLTEFQEQDDMMYNLEATPGEGTSYRLAQMDKRQYPNIKTSGITEPYYTNSTALPVNQTTDLFDALAHQDQILPLYTGGSVHHGFIGEQIHDPNVCKELVKKIANMFKIPYFTITPTFSICPTHGYIAGEHHNCPVITKLRQQEEVTA